jgi:DNA-directed RNA polymerase subunit RPC12/RpoP
MTGTCTRCGTPIEETDAYTMVIMDDYRKVYCWPCGQKLNLLPSQEVIDWVKEQLSKD